MAVVASKKVARLARQQQLALHRPPADPDALVEAHQVRRGVEPYRALRVRRPQRRVAQRADRALPVGAAHVQAAEAPVRVAHPGQQLLGALQPPADPPGGPREQPCARLVSLHPKITR
jgi:hypothetical protein